MFMTLLNVLAFMFVMGIVVSIVTNVIDMKSDPEQYARNTENRNF